MSPVLEGVYAMLGERLGESSGKFTTIRVLPSEGEHVWLEVSFQGRGMLLGREMTETGTYRQTFRAGGVVAGEGHVLMITDSGGVADWVGGGVGRQTGPGYQASYGVWGSCPSATGDLSRLAEVADVIEYEVEGDGSYHWTMWAWTGAGVPSVPRQETPAGAMA